MIHATIRGKLACIDIEDALTGAVFERLRYLPPTILAAWLRRAVPWMRPTLREQPPKLETSPRNIELWPSWPDTLRGFGTVEPDVVLTSADELLVVEAKLWSGKSAVLGPLEESPPDQLARQWKAATDFCADKHRGTLRLAGLIYLTPNLVPPATDLDQSLAKIRVFEADPRLYWLSWAALEDALRLMAATNVLPAALICEDLLAYMDAADVLRFHGWRAAADSVDQPTWHYTGRRPRPYFTEASRGHVVDGWRYAIAPTYRFPTTPVQTPLWRYEKDTRHGK